MDFDDSEKAKKAFFLINKQLTKKIIIKIKKTNKTKTTRKTKRTHARTRRTPSPERARVRARAREKSIYQTPRQTLRSNKAYRIQRATHHPYPSGTKTDCAHSIKSSAAPPNTNDTIKRHDKKRERTRKKINSKRIVN